MNKTLIGVLVTVAAMSAIGGVVYVSNKDASTTSSNQAEKPSADTEPKSAVVETNKVSMENFEFVPAKIKVKKGTTVTWTNNDSAKHNVAPDSPTADFMEGELFGKDGTSSVTFNTVGSFSYHCAPHPYMKASVEVVE